MLQIQTFTTLCLWEVMHGQVINIVICLVVRDRSFNFYGWIMVFNATFNNISVISWWSVLLVEETGVTGENHRPVTSHWQTLSHNVVSSTPHDEC